MTPVQYVSAAFHSMPIDFLHRRYQCLRCGGALNIHRDSGAFFSVLDSLHTALRRAQVICLSWCFHSAQEPHSFSSLLSGSSPNCLLQRVCSRTISRHRSPARQWQPLKKLQKGYVSWSTARNSNLWLETTRFLVVAQHPCSLFHRRMHPCLGSRQAISHHRKQATPARLRQLVASNSPSRNPPLRLPQAQSSHQLMPSQARGKKSIRPRS